MNGFDRLMQAARIEDERLKPGEKAVLCAIASYWNEAVGCAFPSLEQIMRRACYRDRGSLILAVKRLEGLGFLSISRTPGAGNRYTLNAPTSTEKPDQSGNPPPVGKNLTGTSMEKPHGAVGENLTQNTNIKTNIKTNINLSLADANECATTPEKSADGEPEFKLTNDPAPHGVPPCPAQRMVSIFNARCGAGTRTVRIITPARQAALAGRWRFIWKDRQCHSVDECLDHWGRWCNRVAASDFLMNRTDRPFRGGLDRLISQQMFTNVIEGKYD